MAIENLSHAPQTRKSITIARDLQRKIKKLSKQRGASRRYRRGSALVRSLKTVSAGQIPYSERE